MYKLDKTGNFIEFKNGKSIKPGEEGTYPVYGANGIIGMSDKHKEQNSIIIGRVGAYCGSVQFCQGYYWASDNTIVAYPKDGNTEVVFLYYLLKNANLNRWAGGAAQPLMTQIVIKEIELPHPDFHIQQKIAAILSAYDDLIENNTRRIKILEEMAQAIYNEWFVKFRFPGHGKVKMVDSELGKIPEGWEVKKVGDIIKRLPSGKKYDNKSALPKGKIPILDQGQSGIIGFHDNEPDITASIDEPIIVFANHTCYQRIILFPFSSIQNVIPFLPAEDFPRDIYWLHWATKDLIVFTDYKGHFPEFTTKKLVCPPSDISRQFGKIVKPFVGLRYSLEEKNANLRQIRDLLLPKLISGEIDVENLDIKVNNEQ
jgi:type I restriction enzyme, S subunit